MDKIQTIENEQQRRYPGLRVHRDGQAIMVHIPMQFRRVSGSVTILTPDGYALDTPQTKKTLNRTLIKTIAKAFRWQEQIESGQYGGIEELAQALGVNRTYVSRLLRLTNLAPDIIEAILRGQEPESMSLQKLRKDLPLSWEAQRRVWFPEGSGQGTSDNE